MATVVEQNNPYTSGMAAFIAGLRYEAIPPEVIARIKLLILDTLGCGIYAAGKEHSRILRDSIRGLDDSRHCGIWGTTERLSAPHAALVNGAAVQGFEIDDVHMTAILHPGSVTLAPILALAELQPGMSGRRLLTAAVAAYEIGPRVGLCMGNAHLSQGWHAPATQGVFAAVAGASSLLGLSHGQAVHALGIAGTQSSGLMAAQYGAMVKRMNAGRAAQSGLYSAVLAARGFTGIANVFESDYGGFCTTFSASKDRFNLEELTSGLGERFETMQVSLKFYCAAASVHASLDALRAIRLRRPVAANEVEKVLIYGAHITVEHVGFPYRPTGMTGAQMNLPFCMATMLLEGDAFVDQFGDDAITNPDRIALANRIQVIHDPEITALGRELRSRVRVEIHLRDGTVLREMTDTARGRESRFASEPEVIEKFLKLASHVLPAGKTDALISSVLKLEQIENVEKLAALMTPD